MSSGKNPIVTLSRIEMIIRGPKLLSSGQLLVKHCVVQSVEVYQFWRRWKSPRPVYSNCYKKLALCRTRVLLFSSNIHSPITMTTAPGLLADLDAIQSLVF